MELHLLFKLIGGIGLMFITIGVVVKNRINQNVYKSCAENPMPFKAGDECTSFLSEVTACSCEVKTQMTQ